MWYNFAMFRALANNIRHIRWRWQAARHNFRRKFHKKWWYRHFEGIILSLISLCFIMAGLFAFWIANLKIPDLSAFQNIQVSQSTKIYDRTGTVLLYSINQNTRRTVVPFDQISPYIKNATIAIEDSDFYTNIGIKPLSIIRSGLVDIFSGSYDQGGSTITQQVIKNSLLTSNKTIARKIEEWVLAVKLTREMPKNDILATYLNEISYGGTIYGVEEASQAFFGVDASNVDLAQAAYIAALPQAPSYYSPYGANKAALDAREKLVLQRMLVNKFITQAQYNQAVAEQVTFLPKDAGGILAPHFAFYVENELEQEYGTDAVLNGGLKVITTLDYGLQQKMENTISTFGPQIEQEFEASNTASVAINPQNGDILGFVGSRDYYDQSIQGNYDDVTSERQPGSTFKPFVYSTLFEKGFTPDTVLFDVPTEFSTSCTVEGVPIDPTAATSTCYHPQDYDNEWLGPIPIRVALAQSRNVPAVESLYMAGIPQSIQTAEAMGITSLTDANRYGLTLVLGGGEVSLLEMTSAYGVFANDGVRVPYRSILEVQDSNGNILQQAASTTNGVQVIPAQTARQISDILSDQTPGVMMSSIKALVKPMGRPVAIKTGTTNDDRDVWSIGYTPNLVIGVWGGKNDNTPMDTSGTAGLIITPTWAALMTEALQNLPVENFKAPNPTPTTDKPVLRGIWQGGVSYKIDTVSGKVATQYTPAATTKEIVFDDVHSILYWLDPNNPLGPTPGASSTSSQYPYWEYAVQQWMTKTYLPAHSDFKEVPDAAQIIPTATDDVHVPANFPNVTITSPINGTTIDPSQKLTVNFTETGTYPLQKADLYVNGNYITTNNTNSESFSFIPNDIGVTPGINTIEINAYDSVLNQGQATTTFIIAGSANTSSSTGDQTQ